MQRQAMNVWRFFAALLTVFLLAAVPLRAAPAWPQTGSDLAADPNVTFGVLDNGMRYAIRHNILPPNEVSLRLLVLAGSMQEAPDQEGLAHFLEHMAFHGSTHFSDAEMIPTLERLGLKFGADINAFTARDATLFTFDLPRNDDTSIDTGLAILRDIASELTLDPKLMESERKVIMAELHSHPASAVALEAAQFSALFGDHPYARSPIGRTDVIETAPVERLRAFYDAYYRPERSVLVVVGNIDPSQIEAKIKAKFSDWHGRGAPGSDPAPPQLTGKEPPVFRLAVIPGLPAQSLGVFYRHPAQPFHDSRAEAMAREIDGIAGQIAQVRQQELNEKAGRPFTGGNVALGRFEPSPFGRIDFTNAGLVSDWRGTLDLFIRSTRQLEELGVTQEEVDRAIAVRRTVLERALGQAENAGTRNLAAILLGSAQLGYVARSPQQELDLFNEVATGLKAERVSAALHARLRNSTPVIFYSTPVAPDGGEAAMRDVYEKALAAPLETFQPMAVKAWPYTNFGPPGAVAEQKTIAALGVYMVRFANGVRLTIRPARYPHNQIVVSVRFGHGQLDLPKDKLTAADFGTWALNAGGYRDLSTTETALALLGKNVEAFVDQGADSFSLGRVLNQPVSPEDLDLELQVITAKITAPGWRTDSWANFLAVTAHSNESSEATPMGVFATHAQALLHPGDARYVADTAEMRASWKPEDAIAFIKPIVETAPIEVIIAGDVTVDHAIDAVARTLGTLPPRKDVKEPAGLRDVTQPMPTPEPIVLHHKGAAYQALAVIRWPTTDALADSRDTHASAILAAIMTERALAQIRNKEGNAYAPTVISNFSTAFPGYGAILAYAQVQPQDLSEAFADFDTIAADLATNGPTQDEFDRAIKPALASVQQAQFSNVFWLQALGGAQTDPRLMMFAARQVDEYKALTLDDVRAAAKKWLVKDKSWRVEVVPEAQAAAN